VVVVVVVQKHRADPVALAVHPGTKEMPRRLPNPSRPHGRNHEKKVKEAIGRGKSPGDAPIEPIDAADVPRVLRNVRKTPEGGLPKTPEGGLPKTPEGGLPRAAEGDLPKTVEGGLPKTVEEEHPQNVQRRRGNNPEKAPMPPLAVPPIGGATDDSKALEVTDREDAFAGTTGDRNKVDDREPILDRKAHI